MASSPTSLHYHDQHDVILSEQSESKDLLQHDVILSEQSESKDLLQHDVILSEQSESKDLHFLPLKHEERASVPA